MPNRFKAQILVVDDDPVVRTTLGMFLMSAGYDVATADNGITAVAHLSSTVPDLLVTDLNMPLMSGVELISHVRTLSSQGADCRDEWRLPGGSRSCRHHCRPVLPQRAESAASVSHDSEPDRHQPGERNCS